MDIRRIIINALIWPAVAATAAPPEPTAAPIERPLLEVTADSVTLSFRLTPEAMSVGREEALLLTPVIISADSAARQPMAPLAIAGRGRRIRDERHPGGRPEGTVTVAAGGKGSEPASYRSSVARQPWMDHSRVVVRLERRSCCETEERTPLDVADVDMRPALFEAPDFIVEVPAAAGDKTVEISGHAFIDFRVNRTEIDPAYRNNPRELAAIFSTIDAVRANPDATISGITVKGYASPEGSYAANERLARGRTRSLTDHVRALYDFPEGVIVAEWEAEDWAGLRDSVSVSDMPERDGILAIIDSGMEPDARDAAIRRRYPAAYSRLLEEVYPALRHTDYRVRYTIRKYADVAEIRRVMEERPGNLSLDELYLLARSCKPGPEEYDRVMEMAVRLFPDDPASNLNAASAAINRGEFAAAGGYLDRVDGSLPEATYLRGILAARQGRYDEAERYLTPVEERIPAAAEALERIRGIRHRLSNRITYSIK